MPSNTQSAHGFGILFLIIWIIFIVLIFGNALKYFFDLNVKAIMKDLLKPVPKLNLHLNSDKGKKYKPVEEEEEECEEKEDNIYQEIFIHMIMQRLYVKHLMVA